MREIHEGGKILPFSLPMLSFSMKLVREAFSPNKGESGSRIWRGSQVKRKDNNE